MWEISASRQLVTVAASVICGCILCAVYDLLRAARAVKKQSRAVLFLSDVVFFVFAAAAVFFLLLARTGGEIRGYALLSAALGFFLFRMTFSKPLFFIFRFFWSAVAFARRFISGAGGYLLKKCKSGAAFVARNVILFLRGCKKVLKNAVCLLYNKGKCKKGG